MNEPDVVNKMMVHLGLQKGNAVLGIFQKYITGHFKGAPGASTMNGSIQVLHSGLFPGNRNADKLSKS